MAQGVTYIGISSVVHYTDILQGAWYAYRFDSTEKEHFNVKRTPFWLTKSDPKEFIVSYKSAWGDVFGGPGLVINNSLIMSLSHESQRIFLCAALPEKTTKTVESDWLLNAVGITNGHNGVPVMANLILIKNNKCIIRESSEYMKTEVTIINYKGLLPSSKETPSQRKGGRRIPIIEGAPHEDTIITYLSRAEKKDKVVRPFVRNSFEEVSKRNSEFEKLMGRTNYFRLKAKLEILHEKGKYYAFNRHQFRRSEIGIFNYKFSFNDAERICWAERHRVGEENIADFEGEVTLEGPRIYMQLRDQEGQRRKQLIATIGSGSGQSFVLRGISSSVTEINAHPVALRELIVRIDEKQSAQFNDVKTKGFISYKQFYELSNDLIDIRDKLYIANYLQCTLTYPTPNDPNLSYSRQDKARKYAGIYHVFIRNGYDRHQETLLKVILNIDPLAQVEVLVAYDEKRKTDAYYGIAEFYNKNLRIDAFLPASSDEEPKALAMIFDCINEKHHSPQSIFTGVTIDTDDDNIACAFSLIALSQNLVVGRQTTLLNKPQIVSVHDFDSMTNSFPEIAALTMGNTEDFFWKGS